MRHSKNAAAVISTLGLGSCLGVTCYDAVNHVGGLLHAMLPDSQRHRSESSVVPMYLDLGIPALIEGALHLGANIRYLDFKVFGGAQIIQANDYFSIGRQNVEMMKQMAERYHLNVKAWNVGGQVNRSIELHVGDGRVLLRMPNRPEAWV